MGNCEIIKIDVEQVLRTRAPRFARFIPRALVSKLKRIIRQDEMNALLEENAGLEGADFCRGILKSLDVKVDVRFPGRLPDKSHRRVVLVSNHPLGGLDGMALIDMVQRHFGGQVWFVVNDLLMAVKPLEKVFLPINKFGRQSRLSLENIEQAFAGGDPIIIFPAGLCSRLRNAGRGGETRRMVHDLKWQKMFVNRCFHHRRDIVPLYFSGTNSMDFYRKANLRKRLRIGFNLEMILLPREMLDSRHKTFTVTVGQIKPWTAIEAGAGAQRYADALCDEVYALAAEADTPGIPATDISSIHRTGEE